MRNHGDAAYELAWLLYWVALAWNIDLEMHWLGKEELFRFPWNAYFRWMGGEPLDRTG